MAFNKLTSPFPDDVLTFLTRAPLNHSKYPIPKIGSIYNDRNKVLDFNYILIENLTRDDFDGEEDDNR